MDKKKMYKWIRRAVPLMVAAFCIFGPVLTVAAGGTGATDTGGALDTSVVTAPLDALYDLVAAIISGIGLLITLWGISEWGMAYQGTDGVMQAGAWRRIVGGVIMVLAPQILPLLV